MALPIVFVLFHVLTIALALPALLARMRGAPFTLGLVALCSLGFTITVFFFVVIKTLGAVEVAPPWLSLLACVLLTIGSATGSFVGYLRQRKPRLHLSKTT